MDKFGPPAFVGKHNRRASIARRNYSSDKPPYPADQRLTRHELGAMMGVGKHT